MSAPSNSNPLDSGDVVRVSGFVVGSESHRPMEQHVRIAPLEALEKPEPIPDAKNSLSNEQLKELAKRHQPPAAWFEKDEEQLF